MVPAPEVIGVEMAAHEARSFLASHDHGVLSLGIENRGYGFPVGYTYDDAQQRLILGFVSSSGSKKQAFAEETEEVTLTVFEHEDVDAWKSAVVTGPLRRLDEGPDAHQVPHLFFRQPADAGVGDDEMIDLDEFERTWYELRIDTLSGRWSGG